MKPDFHFLGNEALLINFEQKIDELVNKQVHLLTQSLEQERIAGVKYITPAYCSIVVAFDQKLVSYERLIIQINSLLYKLNGLNFRHPKLYIPVCYDRLFALDMPEVISQTRLTASEIVKIHTAQTFKTYMIGFLPGFPYLGKLPQRMEVTRKSKPRLKVPKGAIGLAGRQTGIYPQESPGGWQIIGNTPVDLVGQEGNNSFLFKVGDEISFYSISKSKYDSILEAQKKGNFNWENVYEKSN